MAAPIEIEHKCGHLAFSIASNRRACVGVRAAAPSAEAAAPASRVAPPLTFNRVRARRARGEQRLGGHRPRTPVTVTPTLSGAPSPRLRAQTTLSPSESHAERTGRHAPCRVSTARVHGSLRSLRSRSCASAHAQVRRPQKVTIHAHFRFFGNWRTTCLPPRGEGRLAG